MKKLRKAMMTAVEGALWVAIFFLLFVLIYSIWLTACGIDPACAEELVRYPEAYVKVNDCLNVRRSPGGEWKYMTLERNEMVVILRTEGNWALVSYPEHIEGGWPPLGWVCSDYLAVCGEYLTKKSGGL